MQIHVLMIIKWGITLLYSLKKKGILGEFTNHGKGKVFIVTLRDDNDLRRKEVIKVE